MFDLFARFKKTALWDFKGGIHPPEMKDQTRHVPIRRLSLPERLYIPLQQHAGPEGELLVNVEDYVLKGQPLTAGTGRVLPVHASTSGTVTQIGFYPSTHPSALPERCVQLEPDGLDQWGAMPKVANYRDHEPAWLIAHIHQAGVAGLGGAVFPTANKITGGLSKTKTLIINGAECEPYITADDRLMQEYADELVQGCEILRHILEPEITLIAIEDNKPEAVSALKDALQRHENNTIEVCVIPTKYPSGGARQLTKILTGKEVPHRGRSSDIGVLMQNVGTVYAIKRAVIDGEPLLERIVTLTGEAIAHKGNVWALLGSPVSFLLKQAGYRPQTPPRVIMGGPLMGFVLPDVEVPITKMSNCLIAPTEEEIASPEPEQACIRCSQCADACPAGLLPQQLYWFSRGKEHEKARAYNLFDCIECGACAYVCPSHIPLIQYYRQEKAEIRDLDELAELARTAKIRFEAKQARLEREKQARLLRHKQAETQPDSKDSELIQSALARVKKRQESAVGSSTPPIIKSIDGQALSDNDAAIAARKARKAQRVANAKEHAGTPEVPNSAADDRKAALAAAIARAKAKKAQQATASETEPNAVDVAQQAAIVQDDRKAAVAAAIARVKAKKEQQSAVTDDGETQKESPVTATQEAESAQDDRKAAVAAAIARVKAKKERLAQSTSLTEELGAQSPEHQEKSAPLSEADDRKAAVAEAIARVKARKAQQAAALTTASDK